MINDFFTEYIGPEWKDMFLQAMLIGFGLSCLVFLFTAVVCSGI